MAEDLHAAFRHHQQGRLELAAQVYQAVLAGQPDHADALHLLGVVALQQGNAQRAVALIGRAVVLQPGAAVFHCNLAEAYRALGQFDRAAGCARLALGLQPDYPEAANNLGLALLDQDHAAEAAVQFQEALRLRPDLAMVHNNLGNALRLQGEVAPALQAFRKALEIDPDLAEARSNLGQLLLEHHEPQEALVHCRAAVRLRPHFPQAQNNLGNVLRELGHLAEAKDCYLEALRLQPDLAMTYNNLGQALQEEGRLDEAVAWYQRGLQCQPDLARIHCNLASALEEQDQHDEAVRRYELALRLDPQYAEAHNGLGFVLHEQGQFEPALARYREALRLKPDLAAAHGNLGTVLEELNDFAASERCFRDALGHDPRHPGALAQLATMLRGKLPDADLAVMRQLLADPLLNPGKRSALHFGLAQVLDARGHYQQAAEHLQQANALAKTEWQKRGQGYDPREHSRFVAELMAAFTPEFFVPVRAFGLETQRPIFIVGLPRSGTTLTEQILASHSQVFGAGEQRLAAQAFQSLPQIMGSAATPVECVRDLDRPAAERLAGWHLDQLRQLNATAARVADKMPDNYLYLGLLAGLFPRARFIHCRRDLRDVAVSCWITSFRQIRWASDPDHIAARFAEYRRVMNHWIEVLPVPILAVDYEDTVADLEGGARRLVAWCGLEWEPACLAFHEGKRPVRTASVTQVRQPIYRHAVARWKNYETTLGPLFAKLNAEPADRPPTGTRSEAL